MMVEAYVLSKIDPTYMSSYPVAVCDTAAGAENARKTIMAKLSIEEQDRGVYVRVAIFETNRVY